jgi:hypothetical protein
MSEDERSTPKPPPPWPAPGQAPGPAGAPWHRDETALTRFLGGSPGSVLLRLVFVSLIVGAFLMWLDIRPEDIFRGIIDLVNRIWGLGFDAIRVVGDYILAGAAIVVPVWLVLRLLNMRNGR